MAIQTEGKKKTAIIAGLVVLILVAGLFVGKRLAPKPAPPGQGPWKYTAYGQDVETGEIVEFPVYKQSLVWPLKNPKTGNDSHPLYFCNACGARFVGIGMTTSCPDCGSGNVGAYSPTLQEKFKKKQAHPD